MTAVRTRSSSGRRSTSFDFAIHPPQEAGDHCKNCKRQILVRIQQSQMHDFQEDHSGRRGDLSEARSLVVK